MTVLSYHNDAAIKAAHIAQAERHVAADMLISGTYGRTDDGDGSFRGCSVGCFAHEISPRSKNFHAAVAEAAGWPEWLVRLSDTLFEGLPAGERETFHVDLRRHVPVGANLTPVLHRIAIARMDRLIARQEAAESAPYTAEVLGALRQVRAYHEAPTESAAGSAESAAWSAAESARSAWSAESAARSAVGSAAGSAESAAAEYRAERDALFAALDASA